MSAAKAGPVALALRREIRETVKALGLRMPKGFDIHTVGDQRLCSGFPAHHVQAVGQGWVDHGEWPFVAERPLRASDHCLSQAVGNVLLRIALEQRDAAMERVSKEDLALPWHITTTALTALSVSLRLATGLDLLDDDRTGLTGRIRQDTQISTDPVIRLRTGGMTETIAIDGEYPETVMQAMKGRPLREIVALPHSGRPEIEADIDELIVKEVLDMEDTDGVVRTSIRVDSGPLRCAARPPEGIDPTWLTVQTDGMRMLNKLLEDRKTNT